MDLKVFIVCLDKETALTIAKNMIAINDELSIVPTFTTDTLYKNKLNDKYIYYLDVNVANLSYKNNALLYIKTKDYISSGITIDDFYNNDICILTIEEFNIISDIVFKKHNVLTVWVDSKSSKALTSTDMIEINYFNTFISNNEYLYFLDSENDIHNVILNYIYGDEETKKLILKENN